MSATQGPDLRSHEGPDDWVSLYLDGGVEDDMLNELQVCSILDVTSSITLIFCLTVWLTAASGFA